MNVRMQIKRSAKRALSSYWAKAIAVFLLLLAIMMFFTIMHGILDMVAGIGGFLDVYQTSGNYLDDIPNISLLSMTITGLLSLGMLLIMIPMRLGVKRWYYFLSEGFSDDLLGIFHFFASGKLLLRALALEIQLGVRSLFWTAVFFAPAVLCGGGAWYFAQQPAQPMAPLYATLLVISSFLLALGGGFGLLVMLNKYFLAKYYILSGDVSAYRAVKKSCRATKGFRRQIFVFHLSFIGWFALGIFALPLLFVQPYYCMSSVLYARYLIESEQRRAAPPQEKEEPRPEGDASDAPQEAAAENPPPQWPVNKEYGGDGKGCPPSSGEEPGTGFILVDSPQNKE